MSQTSKSESGGVGFGSLLLLLFIGLKLGHVITWSWWWVLSPALVAGALIVIALGIWGTVVCARDHR